MSKLSSLSTQKILRSRGRDMASKLQAFLSHQRSPKQLSRTITLSAPLSRPQFSLSAQPGFGPAHATSWSKRSKTYSSWDSLLVTHATTNQPVRCLTSVSRRGLVFSATCGRMCLLTSQRQ
ncbi:hypothetical protein EJ06DRAFT_60278 [Trichodelitschia bisporula]|uniref:Uncharacterized protein n=1 Tax=Trichodelitschia bisporula TaxID=703511 RepID=A0A6G1HUM2_9PEZI|nr:hypothetical protein EJ06DRAFT_60278 [Trichodelitschia bisporula]